jgi:hypothetical protein
MFNALLDNGFQQWTLLISHAHIFAVCLPSLASPLPEDSFETRKKKRKERKWVDSKKRYTGEGKKLHFLF